MGKPNRRVKTPEARRGDASPARAAATRPDAVRREVDGLPLPLLQALHLVTRDGQLNADARRKLKQVQHLVGLLRPALEDALARAPEPVVVEFGAGKAYLGFVLAELVLRAAGRGVVTCVEARPELVAGGAALAAAMGQTRMRFVEGEVAHAALPERVHVVTALHACDTATDDALFRAIRAGADHVAVVPCCQAELARLWREAEAPIAPPWDVLQAHAWHRREHGSHVTNVLRALALEAHGYQVTVTELTGWEHALKNELILGRRVHRENARARARLDALVAAIGARPRLVRLLDGESASTQARAPDGEDQATPRARSSAEAPDAAPASVSVAVSVADAPGADAPGADAPSSVGR
jgi:hypothetical protein